MIFKGRDCELVLIGKYYNENEENKLRKNKK